MSFRHRLNALSRAEYVQLCTATHVMRSSASFVASKVFDNPRINVAGGDLPKSLGVRGLEPIIRAAESVDSYEYVAPGTKDRIREAVAPHFSLSPDRIFFATGLSAFSRELYEKHRLIHGDTAVAIHPAGSHPLFYQDAHFNLGRNGVIELRRLPDGKPDFEHLKRTLDENKGRKMLVALVPWENPTGIIYDEKFFTEHGSGFFEQLAPFRNDIWLYLDGMYNNFNYVDKISLQCLLELVKAYSFVGAVGAGLSKIMLGPGMRGAAVGLFGPSDKIDELYHYFVRWETSTIEGGVSVNTLLAIETAFSGNEEVTRAISVLKGRVKEAVFPNREVLLSTPGVFSTYNSLLECAFYQFFRVQSDKWSNQTYLVEQWKHFKASILAKIEEAQKGYVQLGHNPDDAAKDLRRFIFARELLSSLRGFSEPRLDPDEAFVVDMIENHGIAFAPGGSLFYEWDSPYIPLGQGEIRQPLVRAVLSNPASDYAEISRVISSL